MQKEYIYTEKAAAPTAPYSQAVKVDHTVYLSGVCGDDPVTGKIMGDDDISVETRYAMENLRNTIEAAGGTLQDIVKVNVFISDITKLGAFNTVYKTFFSKNLPARIATEVSRLSDGANLELDAIAVL